MRLTRLLICLCLGASLVGCAGEESEAPEAETAAPAQEPQPQETPAQERAAQERAGGETPDREVPIDFIAEAAWSPDGSRLAVTWDRGTGARLYGMLAGTDSSPPEPGRGLPLSDGRGAWAAWAPDGLWVAFETRGDLARMRPDGTFAEPLLEAPGTQTRPAWSSDGSRLAFLTPTDPADPSSLPGIGLMAVRASTPEVLELDVEGRATSVAWHPEGTLVAGLVTADGPGIHHVDRESGSTRRLASGEDPAVSPDGAWLWYARNDSIFRRSWSAGQEGAPGPEESVVTPGHRPAPAPDGLRLAYVVGNRPTSTLYLLHLETGERLRLSEDPPARR